LLEEIHLHLRTGGQQLSEVAKKVANKYGISRNRVYQFALGIKRKIQ
jgi:hypothetical protein